MTATILKDELRHARKHYTCDAYQWFHACGMRRDELTPDQQSMLDAAEADSLATRGCRHCCLSPLRAPGVG